MIEISHAGAIATVKMEHGKVNAMDIEFCTKLLDSLNELKDSPCTGVVITGNERVFSAGIDLKRWLAEGEDYVEPFMLQLEELFEQVFVYPKPVVAKINGAAIAGGCMLAAACDFRIIANNSKIGILESRLGVPLPMMAIEIVRHVLVPSAFRNIISVGATFNGPEAVTAGLADQAVDIQSIDTATDAAAEQLTALPIAAFQLTKQQRTMPVVRICQQNRSELLANYLAIWKSPKTRAAISLYVEERLK